MNADFKLVRRTDSEKKAYLEGYREGAMAFAREVQDLIPGHELAVVIQGFESRVRLQDEVNGDEHTFRGW